MSPSLPGTFVFVKRPLPPPTLDAGTLRQLAVEAVCDPRTIRAVLAGQFVRGSAGARAREVLVKAGYLPQEGAK